VFSNSTVSHYFRDVAAKRAYKNFVRFGRSGMYPSYDHEMEYDTVPDSQVEYYLPYDASDPSSLYAIKRAHKNFLRFGRGYKNNFVR